MTDQPSLDAATQAACEAIGIIADDCNMQRLSGTARVWWAQHRAAFANNGECPVCKRREAEAE